MDMKTYEKIYAICINNDVDDCERQLKNTFKNVRFVDEKIDDGLDEDEVYLMMRSFEVDGHYLRLYFCNDDYIVTDFEIK